MDFDPERITYAQLVDVFWQEHPPTSGAWSSQYAHILFWEGEEQRAVAEASARKIGESLGRKVATRVRPLDRFYQAEDYHQKYYLRNTRELIREFDVMYRADADFVASTAAARVNGWLGGAGEACDLLAEIDSYGLSSEGRAVLLRRAGVAAAPGCAVNR